MADIFEEVEEELRRDRLLALWRRFRAPVLAIVGAVVLGVGGYSLWTNWTLSAQQADTARVAAVLETVERDGPATVAKALESTASSLGGDHARLVRLTEARLLLQGGDVDGALAVYDALAGDADAPAMIRDYALLLSALFRLDKSEPAKVITQVEPLTADNNPYRFTALEITALAALRQDDTQRAHEIFARLRDDRLGPAGVRARARELAERYAPAEPSEDGTKDGPAEETKE